MANVTSRNESQGGIPIALIGPAPMVGMMLKAIKSFPSFVPLTGTYRQLEESAEVSKELNNQAEVILYSGPLPYRYCQEHLGLSVPAHYVPLTGSGLFRSLFRLHGKNPSDAYSGDTLAEATFTKAYKELDLPSPTLYVHKNTYGARTEELIGFHLELYRSGRTGGAFTAVHDVAVELAKEGVPTEWITPTEQDIIVALERALLSTETRKSNEAQIVVGLINVDGFRKAAAKRSSESDVQRLKLDVHRMMLEYAESLEGHLTALGGEEYLFVTTRGTFERQTGGYKYIPLAKQAQESFGLQLSIGIGFGRSASDAGSHARTALRHAKDAGGNNCFIVREDGSIIGPLEMSEPLDTGFSLIDANLLKRAEEAGLTRTYFSKLTSHVARTGQVDFNVHQLAEVFGITVRSTHRLLLQWTDAGFVDIVGEQRRGTKGRPNQVFRFVVLNDCLREAYAASGKGG